MKAPFTGCTFKEYPAGSITQYFAENPALYAKMGMSGHNGIDLVAPHGTPLVAVEAGTVVNVKNDANGYGKHIRFITSPTDGVCREWTYGHLDTIAVAVGDKVTAGQQVGTMGNTGFVVSGQTAFWNFNPYAGTHLHLGLRNVKRSATGWAYEGSTIKIKVLNYENGFKGAIDSLSLFTDAADPEKALLETKLSLLQQVFELLKRLKGVS